MVDQFVATATMDVTTPRITSPEIEGLDGRLAAVRKVRSELCAVLPDLERQTADALESGSPEADALNSDLTALDRKIGMADRRIADLEQARLTAVMAQGHQRLFELAAQCDVAQRRRYALVSAMNSRDGAINQADQAKNQYETFANSLHAGHNVQTELFEKANKHLSAYRELQARTDAIHQKRDELWQKHVAATEALHALQDEKHELDKQIGLMHGEMSEIADELRSQGLHLPALTVQDAPATWIGPA